MSRAGGGVLDLAQHGNGKRNARLCSFVLSCCRVISSMLVLVLVLVLVVVLVLVLVLLRVNVLLLVLVLVLLRVNI